MHIGEVGNLSLYRVFKTANAITSGAFTVVNLSENGVATSAAGDIPIGLLVAETSNEIAIGEDVNVQLFGGGLWIAGEAIKAGDLLAAGEDGKAKKATTGEYVFAIALDTGAINQAVAVQIIHGGKA